MPKFSKVSLDILSQAHPDLQRLFKEVIKEYDCSITCSYRGQDEQEKAFKEGNSKAHFGQSFHNYIPSLAVDCVPFPSLWSDKKKLKELGAIVKIKAIDLKINLTWGGDWIGWKDLPHYELSDAREIIKNGESKLGT